MTAGPLISDSLELISKWEWFRDKAYQDVAGVWTIGHGFTRNPDWTPIQPWQTITREESERRLEQEVANRQNFKNFIKIPLTPNQEAALSSFEFNLWSNIWNTTWKAIIDNINKWNLEEASRILKLHNKAWWQTIQWLVNRRNEEAKLLLS